MLRLLSSKSVNVRSVLLLLRSMSASSVNSEGAMSSLPLSMADVESARTRIREHVHYTPVMTCSYLNSLSGLQLYFKCENFQRTGAFKIRGATNAVSIAKSEYVEKHGTVEGLAVVTHSSGNHAMAVSLAAKTFGVPAHIVMPKSSPQVKQESVRGYGGNITLCDQPTEESRGAATKVVLEKLGPGAMFISSANNSNIMAGQGTIAVEFLEQVPDLDVMVASVSGGGLMGGMCVAAKSINPKIVMVGAEPKNADDCARSLAAGKRLANETPPDTICDALKMSIYELPWTILSTHLAGVVTVTEEEIITAMKLVFERMKLVIEPAAACSLAAVLNHKFQEVAGAEVKKVGVVLCGGNTDMDKLPWMTNKTK